MAGNVFLHFCDYRHEHQVNRRLILVVGGEAPTIFFQHLVSEDEMLLSRGDSLLVIDFKLQVTDHECPQLAIVLELQNEGVAVQTLHEKLGFVALCCSIMILRLRRQGTA